MLLYGLRELSFESEILSELPSDFADRAIVVGANLFKESDLAALPAGSIILNVENSSSQFMSKDYIRLLRRFVVWDYSAANAESLSRMISRPVHYLKMFYVGELTRIGDAPIQDIDVLFFGSFNERRQRALAELKSRGLVLEAVFGVYGEQLDQLISRAKVILNLHFYENGHLEMIRIFDLLANGKAVCSELNPNALIDEDLIGAFAATPYEGLADAAETLVRDPEVRAAQASAGFRIFRQRQATTILSEALAMSELPRLPSEIVIGSGKMYDSRVLNVDIDRRWHPDIVADISDPGLFDSEFVSRRHGAVRLVRGWFDNIVASHVLEHIPDLVQAMTNCLNLLTEGGTFRIVVPYDLSYGAWQDPTHVHAFNERSWLYYCEWYWYLSWEKARFDLVEMTFRNSPLGDRLAGQGIPQDEILRTSRAVDEMHAVLRKRLLTEAEREYGRGMRGESRALS